MITTEAPSRENLDNFLQKEKEETHFDGSVSYDKKKTISVQYFGMYCRLSS